MKIGMTWVAVLLLMSACVSKGMDVGYEAKMPVDGILTFQN